MKTVRKIADFGNSINLCMQLKSVSRLGDTGLPDPGFESPLSGRQKGGLNPNAIRSSGVLQAKARIQPAAQRCL